MNDPRTAAPGSADHAPSGTTQDYGQILVDGVTAFFSTADDLVGRRLANSHTVCHFHLTDAEPLGFTLWFDRVPIQAEARIVGDAEVEIYAATDSFAKVFLGREHMGLLIARGEITFKGPVRKMLRAAPIMRTLDTSHLKDLAAIRRRLSTAGNSNSANDGEA
jgi:hypothetical protein